MKIHVLWAQTGIGDPNPPLLHLSFLVRKVEVPIPHLGVSDRHNKTRMSGAQHHAWHQGSLSPSLKTETRKDGGQAENDGLPAMPAVA